MTEKRSRTGFRSCPTRPKLQVFCFVFCFGFVDGLYSGLRSATGDRVAAIFRRRGILT